MSLKAALALACVVSTTAFSCSGGVHTLTVNETTGSYAVTVAGSPWFQNGTVAVHQGGIWYSTANNSLALEAASASSGVDSLLGSFHAFTLNYSSSALTVAASFRCYAAGVLVFELAFVDGATNVNTESPGDVPSGGGEFNASSAPSCHFPSFAAAPLQSPDIGFLEWNGRFTNDNDAFGVGLRGFTGGATGGPLTLFAVNTSAPPPAPAPPATVVIGAFDNFKSTMLARVPEPAAPPPSPTCSNVTPGVDQVGGSGCTAVGLNVSDQAACCAACASNPCCETWVFDPVNLMPPAPGENCWPLRGVVSTTPSPNRTVGVTRGPSGRLVAGVQGYAVNLAPGYVHKVVLVSSAAGITDAVLSYGAGLQAAYGTAAGRPPPSEDVLSHKLSYWTDNGAYYDCSWWSAWARGQPTANDVLRNLSAWHAEAGFPFASYQLDPWWYVGTAQPAGCGLPTNWSADPPIWPDGLRATGLPLTLYSSYYAPVAEGNVMTAYSWTDSVYLNMGWFVGTLSQVVAEDAEAFFTDIMQKGLAWGMNAFEVDFLDFSYLTITDRVNSTETYTTWLRGMATAAAGAHVSVQLCMDLPSDALLSTQLPRLSNARASEDDFPGTDSRWDIGVSSLLYAAVGLRPFYDDTWTVEYQPGSPYGPGAKETFVEVSVIIATLSTGGVGISDGAGLGNATLALMSCAADGTLLQPSRPATPIDASFLPGWPASARVWQAPSFAAGVGLEGRWWATVLAIDVAAPLPLTAADLSPPPLGPYVFVQWSPGTAALERTCADGAPAAGCVGVFGEGAPPLVIQTGAEGGDASKPHELYSLAPVYANGWALLGELGKVTRVSVQRFVAVAADDPGYALPNLVFTVAGFPQPGQRNDTAAVTVLAPGGVMRGVRLSWAAPGTTVVACVGTGAASLCAPQAAATRAGAV